MIEDANQPMAWATPLHRLVAAERGDERLREGEGEDVAHAIERDEGEQDERVAGLKWGERAEDSAELKAASLEYAKRLHNAAAHGREARRAQGEVGFLVEVGRRRLAIALRTRVSAQVELRYHEWQAGRGVTARGEPIDPWIETGARTAPCI